MRITFLGGAQTVTGSCYLVETAQTAFLVDCGMFQGAAREVHANNERLPYPLKDTSFMLLTHAHIDHSGRIPRLYKEGFRGRIHATKATADLCALMLPDSGHIQEMEHEWRNRKRRRAGQPQEPPLYTVRDAEQTLTLFSRERYDVPFQPVPGVTVTFRDAGHILGSAITEIAVEEADKTMKVVFSGDLGNTGIPIMRDPTSIAGADVLIMESTYGDRLHQTEADAPDKVDRFVSIVNDTIRAGGNVVIPSFAVGRTQELIYEINRQIALENGNDPSGKAEARQLFLNTPVVVDSPLAISATEVFRDNEDCFDAEAQAYIRNRDNPLDFPNLRMSRTLQESKAINTDPVPKIIIASSGMCDAGRIRHHLKHNLWRADSTILFVGYQAPGTLGRQLVEGEKEVRLFGEDITVNARVETISGYSGHADQNGLLAWVTAMSQKPAQIVLVHGEPDAMETLGTLITERFGVPVRKPAFGEAVVIGQEVPERRVCPEERPYADQEGEAVSAGVHGTERPQGREALPGRTRDMASAGHAAEQPTAKTIAVQLDALRDDFLKILEHVHETLRRADNRRARERAVSGARTWEREVRRTMERYHR